MNVRNLKGSKLLGGAKTKPEAIASGFAVGVPFRSAWDGLTPLRFYAIIIPRRLHI